MIRRLFIYLKAIRVVESTLMTGFPLIGFIVALHHGAFHTFAEMVYTVILFCLSTFPLVIYVYTFNSWGGRNADSHNKRLDDHPVLTGEMSERELRYLAYAGLITNLILYWVLFPRCFVLAPLIALNWTAYSHPRVMAKARPIAGTTVHFIGGVLQVLLGYVVISGFDLKGLLFAVYFSMVFSAGHLNHEVKDYNADKEAGLRTNAIVFGPRFMLNIAFALFTISFFYLLFLSLGNRLSLVETWPFLAIYPGHLWLHIRMIGSLKDRVYDLKYQRDYRALFVAAGVILLATKLLFMWNKG